MPVAAWRAALVVAVLRPIGSQPAGAEPVGGAAAAGGSARQTEAADQGLGPGFGDCAEHVSCATCAAAPAWLRPCVWCPADQLCRPAPRHNGQDPCAHNGSVSNRSACPPAPPRSTSFDLQEAYSMVLHAHCVYWDDPSVLGILPPSFRVLHTFKFRLGPWENAFGYLGFDSDSHRVVIAFRGTANLVQLSDEILHHRLVNETWSGELGVLVNEYFLAAVNDLVNVTKLGTVLGDLLEQHPGCEIWLTGHSLGASLAMIMAYRISWLVSIRPTVYTYGQPRTGNAAFAKLVAATLPRAFRLVNDMDPVPHVPLCDHSGTACSATLHGYYHAGIEMWFPSGDYSLGLMCGFRECLGAPLFEDRSCSNGVTGPAPERVYQHHGYFEVIPFGFCGGALEDAAGPAAGPADPAAGRAVLHA